MCLCRVDLSHFSTRFSCVFPPFFPLHYTVHRCMMNPLKRVKEEKNVKKFKKNESDDQTKTQNSSNFSSHFLLKVIPFLTIELNFIPLRCFMMCLDSNLVDRMQLNFFLRFFRSFRRNSFFLDLELRSFVPRQGLKIKSRGTS